MAVPTSWQEGRNSIVTTVSRKTAHRRISFLIVAVSAPERHWIRFQSHFARAAHATYSVGMVRSSGRTHIYYLDRYIKACAWQYKFHHLTYLREARFARQLGNLRHFFLHVVHVNTIFFLIVMSCIGSGKTHTIEGGHRDQKGVIPRASEMIFHCMS